VTEVPKPTLIVGSPTKWGEFERRNVAFLQAWPRAHRLIERFFLRDLGSPAKVDVLVFYLGRLCVEDFAELLLVCGNGYGIAGKKLLRGLYERAVAAQYLHAHPEEADHFEEYWFVTLHKLARVVRETLGAAAIPDEEWMRIEGDAMRVRDNFRVTDCEKCKTTRINHTWSKSDFVTMARENPALWSLVASAYYDTLPHAHANFGGILQRLGVQEDAVTFTDESSASECDFVLGTAHTVLLLALELQRVHFQLNDLTSELNGCLEDNVRVWSARGSHGDAD